MGGKGSDSPESGRKKSAARAVSPRQASSRLELVPPLVRLCRAGPGGFYVDVTLVQAPITINS